MSIHWKNTKKAFVFKLSCCSMFSISAVLNSTLFNSTANTSSKINFLTFEMLHWLLLLVLLFQLAILRRRKKNLQIAMTVQFLPITLAQLCSKIKEYYLGLIDKVFSLNQGVLFRQNTFYPSQNSDSRVFLSKKQKKKKNPSNSQNIGKEIVKVNSCNFYIVHNFEITEILQIDLTKNNRTVQHFLKLSNIFQFYLSDILLCKC